MNKQEFRDALCLRYGLQLSNIPSHCVCGTAFSVDHAVICQRGGLTFIRHNELRDLTAEWLQEVCHDVAVEPPLLSLLCYLSLGNPSHHLLLTAVAMQELISMQGAFWDRRQGALFDIRVFHVYPDAPSYHQTQAASLSIDVSLRKSVNMEIMYAMLNVNPLPHLFFLLLVAWAKKLLFSTTILTILYPRSMLPPTTRYSPGCIVPSHFLYYVLLCWLFKGTENCSCQSTLLSSLNCI